MVRLVVNLSPWVDNHENQDSNEIFTGPNKSIRELLKRKLTGGTCAFVLMFVFSIDEVYGIASITNSSPLPI